MGDKIIIVKVGDIEYATVIDKDGTQRFIANDLNRFLVDSGYIDLIRLNYDYGCGKFSKREYAEFYMSQDDSFPVVIRYGKHEKIDYFPWIHRGEEYIYILE